MVPYIDASLETYMFPQLTTRPIMNSDKHDLLVKFWKLKHLVFRGPESEDAYDFLIDCHELVLSLWHTSFRKMLKYGGGCIFLWLGYLFLTSSRRRIFLRYWGTIEEIEQRKMSIVAYEVKLYALSRFYTQLFFSPKERIYHFVKGLRLGLQI